MLYHCSKTIHQKIICTSRHLHSKDSKNSHNTSGLLLWYGLASGCYIFKELDLSFHGNCTLIGIIKAIFKDERTVSLEITKKYQQTHNMCGAVVQNDLDLIKDAQIQFKSHTPSNL